MGVENFNSAEILAQVDPVAILQVRLGISEAEAQDVALIRVGCTEPGVGAESSLGEYITSEHGKDTKAEQIIKDVLEERADGANLEVAMRRALGMAAMRDPETGKLVRVMKVAEESKKK